MDSEYNEKFLDILEGTTDYAEAVSRVTKFLVDHCDVELVEAKRDAQEIVKCLMERSEAA